MGIVICLYKDNSWLQLLKMYHMSPVRGQCPVNIRQITLTFCVPDIGIPSMNIGRAENLYLNLNELS